MPVHLYLPEFSSNELILNSHEAKHILIFFFPNQKNKIENTAMNDTLRAYAQGLLVVAIDSSNKMGWAETLFQSSLKPNASVRGILRSFGLRAIKSWFKHTDIKNLKNIKIYECIRNTIQNNFGREFSMLLDGFELSKVPKLIILSIVSKSKVWAV